MRKVQKGFTLIELMIVVAIIGILAAIAIPAYQDYTVRAQVSEGLTMASALKASVAEFYSDRGVWPVALANLGITVAPSGKYVGSVAVATGTLNITYAGPAAIPAGQANAAINGSILSIRPVVSGANDVIWVCGNRATPAGGSDPTSGAASANATTLLAKYMPSNCRL